MVWFDFKTPPRALTDRIRFEDEEGVFSLTDILDATWVRLTNPQPIPDWPEWYVLVSRLVAYASEVCPGQCDRVASWPACCEPSDAADYVFCDDTGVIPLADVTTAIEGWPDASPRLAKRLARLIIHIAERRRRDDRIAFAILDQADLQLDDV